MPRQLRIDIGVKAEKQIKHMKGELAELDTPNIMRLALSELHKRLFPDRKDEDDPGQDLTIY